MEYSSRKINNNVDDDDDDDIFDDSSVLANFQNISFRDNNANKSSYKLNISASNHDEDIIDYDKVEGKTWIYPTNYKERDYQFNIIRAAIVKNTLVSLPTGLGKTFIAAVVMYNFYRWYPRGKIIFMAPTRPLVAQQIDACYNIIGLPPNDTVEMTGHMQVNARKNQWQKKRVFFATPQVIYNDIKSGICQENNIRCLVFDEAHKARGNYAYCQIISTLTERGHKLYRVLALSATPGSKIEDIINVIKNLNIAHMELRNENSIDVMGYSHSRKINTVVIPLGSELTQLRQKYVEILDGYARRLKQINILPQNSGNLSKGRIVMLYKEFQARQHGARHPQHNYIMKDFTLLIALYHGLELLIKHGSRVFLNFFDEHPEKKWIQTDDNLTSLLERLRDDLGIDPLSLNTSVLPDGTIPEMPKNLAFGHPKFYKLKEIMLQHFENAKQKGQDTKAIVFCEYRESVNLVHCLLLQCRPLIIPQKFVGQSATGRDGRGAVSQKAQARVMRSFRSGGCNALVCTCVAEEGLDVGAVDLILCFDISTRSPVRLVQRCGRTGRERGGQVFILVTEGKEHQTLVDCMRQRDGLNEKIIQSKEVKDSLYKMNPRMIPPGFTPECKKMFITVEKLKNKDKEESGQTKKKDQRDLKSMLFGKASTSNSASKDTFQSDWITKKDFDEIYPKGYRDCNFFAKPKAYCSIDKASIKCENKNDALLNLSTWLEYQRSLQSTVTVGHSEDTEILTALLKYNSSKQFDIPFTMTPISTSQESAARNPISPAKAKQKRKKQKFPLIKSPCKKDGDIRTLFSTATKSTKNYTKLINDLGISNDGKIPTSIVNLFADLCLESKNVTKKCYICLYVCDCKVIQNMRSNGNHFLDTISTISEPDLPDIDLIDNLNKDSFLKYARETCNKMEYNVLPNDHKNDARENIFNNTNTNFDIELDIDSFDELSPVLEKEIPKKIIDNNDNIQNNFEIGDIEDIFAESSPEKNLETKETCNENKPEVLQYFNLDSIEDIFAYSDDEVLETTTENKPSNDCSIKEINIPKTIRSPSPSILSGKTVHNNIKSTSPILCSQKNKLSMKRTRDRQINQFQSSTPINRDKYVLQRKSESEQCVKETHKINNSGRDQIISDRSMLTITQIEDMIINKRKDDSSSRNDSLAINQDKTENIIERSSSPIILTQKDKDMNRNVKKTRIQQITNTHLQQSTSVNMLNQINNQDDMNKISNKQNLSSKDSRVNDILDSDCIILDSDSDDERCMLKINTEIQNDRIVQNKRKFQDEEECLNSPYFNKKPKVNDSPRKGLSLQRKVMAALASNKNSNSFGNKNTQANFMIQSPLSPRFSYKENKDPFFTLSPKNEKDPEKQNQFDSLQLYRRENLCSSVNKPFKNSTNTLKTDLLHKRKIRFSDSDDDFVSHPTPRRKGKTVHNVVANGFINHKKKTRKKKDNEFLDLEAELSDDRTESGDELTDESVGSIINFICDENDTHDDVDIHALYLKSVKSPVKGVFKIPQLQDKYKRDDVFSQSYVENDTYEMDSFCVDSHVGLTQANEVSELELAEMLLEEKRRRNKYSKNIPKITENGDNSPVIRKRLKKVKRQISSDSDDSS